MRFSCQHHQAERQNKRNMRFLFALGRFTGRSCAARKGATQDDDLLM